MATLLRNGSVYRNGKMQDLDVLISETGAAFFPYGAADVVSLPRDTEIIDLDGAVVFPGLADVHVHFREPGFSYKATIRSESRAAARGGYTQVLTMPNVRPVPSTLNGVRAQLDLIRRDSCIQAVPYGSITQDQSGRGELSDMESIAPYVCAFSDDGHGVQDEGLMRAAMETAHDLGKIVCAHCEDESLVHGTGCHAGAFAAKAGLTGISSESEWRQVERDVRLSDETGCAYHVCHVSTRESVEILRDAKKSGVNVSCETAPHYLTLTDADLEKYPLDSPEIARFKMYPPLRGEKDREALTAGLLDGTIDMIATDHAPHTADEKSRGLLDSANGVVGLETAFAVMYTKFVEPGILPLEKLVDLMAIAPRRRFGLPGSEVWTGLDEPAGTGPDAAVFDVSQTYRIDPDQFAGMGRSTPFAGWEVRGLHRMTFLGGRRLDV